MSMSDDDSLHWLAMRYVLDELSSAEREEFEKRLADDVAACEAVANAARMALGLQSAMVEGASVQRADLPRRGSRSSAGTTAVTVAILTVCCALLAVIGFDRSSGWMVDSQSNSFAKLFLMPSDSVSDSSDDAEDDSVDPDSEVDIPRWMLAGVILEKHGTVLDDSDEVKDN